MATANDHSAIHASKATTGIGPVGSSRPRLIQIRAAAAGGRPPIPPAGRPPRIEGRYRLLRVLVPARELGWRPGVCAIQVRTS